MACLSGDLHVDKSWNDDNKNVDDYLPVQLL